MPSASSCGREDESIALIAHRNAGDKGLVEPTYGPCPAKKDTVRGPYPSVDSVALAAILQFADESFDDGEAHTLMDADANANSIHVRSPSVTANTMPTLLSDISGDGPLRTRSLRVTCPVKSSCQLLLVEKEVTCEIPSRKMGKPVSVVEISAVPRLLPDTAATIECDAEAQPEYEDVASSESLQLLGPFEELGSLRDEFKFNSDFAAKVDHLEELGFSGWRRVRGDGNCFYRSVGFGLLEKLVSAATEARERWSLALVSVLESLSFKEPCEADANSRLVTVAKLASCGRCSADEIRRSILDEDEALVRAMRRLAANYILRIAAEPTDAGGLSAHDVAKIDGYLDASDFCSKVVLPFGKEAHSLAVVALPRALGADVNIALMDRSGTKVYFCECPANEVGKGDVCFSAPFGTDHVVPCVEVQLRPGHYDLLYRNIADSRIKLHVQRPTSLSVVWQNQESQEFAI